MRWLLTGILLLTLCGCTPLRLQRATNHQGSTISEIQYQQVLDNLARFACEPNALAWHVKVTGGLVQVSDQAEAMALPSQVVSPLVQPSVGVTRNVLGQWNVDTVIESDDLELLQLAYQKAINPADERRELKKLAVEKICELSGSHHIVLASDVVDEMIETLKINASVEQVEKLKQKQTRLAELYERVQVLMRTDLEPRVQPLGVPPTASPTATELVAVKKEIVRTVVGLSKEPFLGDPLEKQLRGPLRIEQAEGKIHALWDLFSDKSEEPNPFNVPWVRSGCKKDIPPCTCYTGHYKGCQGNCYVWVQPEDAKTLRDFILIILSLAPPDVQEFSTPRGVGAAFSPNS